MALEADKLRTLFADKAFVVLVVGFELLLLMLAKFMIGLVGVAERRGFVVLIVIPLEKRLVTLGCCCCCFCCCCWGTLKIDWSSFGWDRSPASLLFVNDF